MPITLTAGTLVRSYESYEVGTLTAIVRYTFSNGATEEKSHTDLPMADVQTIATAAGRTNYAPADIAQYVTAMLGADLAPIVIGVASPGGA